MLTFLLSTNVLGQDYEFQYHVQMISTWYRFFIMENFRRSEHDYEMPTKNYFTNWKIMPWEHHKNVSFLKWNFKALKTLIAQSCSFDIKKNLGVKILSSSLQWNLLSVYTPSSTGYFL